MECGGFAPRPHGLQLGEGARAHQETRELGQELLYTGIPISEVFRQDMGIGGVLSLLWFQRRLPPYVCKFLEMCLMIMAAQPSGHYALPGGKSMDRSNN